MKTVRRLIYRSISASILFVAVGFLSLFYFIDLVDELGNLGKSGYGVVQAALYGVLLLPGHLYELAPIAVLIGSIYTLSRMAQSSEFTILRTGGLAPSRALGLLAGLGLWCGLVTFVVGDYVAPIAERQASHLHASLRGGLRLGPTGAWLKTHANTASGETNFAVSVGGVLAGNQLRDVRIFEFGGNSGMRSRTTAATGEVNREGVWTLRNVNQTTWLGSDAPGGQASVQELHLDTFTWTSDLTADVVAAAVLPESGMSTLELFRYISHLDDNEQAAQSQQILFWKRALYPLTPLVMVALALPFAYLHPRGRGISAKVFGGIMLGIGFVLLNNVASHLGLLQHWTPWLVAAAPSALFLALSLSAFALIVRYR